MPILLLIFIKIYVVRMLIFDNYNLLSALWIEWPALIFFAMSVELIFKHKRKGWLYFATNVVLSIIFFALVVYYRYFGSLATYAALAHINQVGEVRQSIALLIKPSYWLLFADLLVLLIILLHHRWRHVIDRFHVPRKSVSLSLLIVSGAIVIVHVLNSIDGSIINEHRKAESMGLLTYQAYVVYADSKRDYTPQYDLNLRMIQSVKRIVEPANPQYYNIAHGQDIYVIQLEAFQNFVIGLTIDGREVTPVLNALRDESFYFPHVFQQIGLGNTADAEFIMNASVHSSGNQSLSAQFGNREVPSLPRYLKEHGYESVTLHTNDASFWDRDLMYPALGFDRYYDRSYFGDEDFMLFGASDEVLYERSLTIFRHMKEQGHHIYANLIAMSSHSPFQIPEEKHPFPLPAYLQGHLIGDYIQAVHYADYALGQFIAGLKEEGLWDEATLVIYGDHFGFSLKNDAHELNLAAQLLGIDAYTQVEMFNIPLIIRVAGHEEAVVVDSVGGQVDLLPTISNLLGLDLSGRIYFGQDLLNQSSNLIPLRVYSPTGSFINDDVMFIPGKGFADGTVIPLHDRTATFDLQRFESDFERALRLIELSDEYLHSLPLRN